MPGAAPATGHPRGERPHTWPSAVEPLGQTSDGPTTRPAEIRRLAGLRARRPGSEGAQAGSAGPITASAPKPTGRRAGCRSTRGMRARSRTSLSERT